MSDSWRFFVSRVGSASATFAVMCVRAATVPMAMVVAALLAVAGVSLLYSQWLEGRIPTEDHSWLAHFRTYGTTAAGGAILAAT